MKLILASALCLLGTLALGQNLPTNRLVSTDFRAGSRTIEQAVDRLTATNTIYTTAWAEYKAGQAVMLSPGFEAKSGSTFVAYIDNTFLSAKSETISEELVESLAAYPNPFENAITITYVLPKSTQVTLFISDEKGAIIARLVDGQEQEAGKHKIEWQGSLLQTGKYICILDANNKRIAANLLKK
jgi:hypothetical protein